MLSHRKRRPLLRQVAASLALCFAWWATAGTVALAAGGRAERNPNGFCRTLTLAEMQAFTGSQMAPPPPTNLKATGGGYTIDLTWTSQGGLSFNVKRGTAQGGPYDQLDNTTSTSYTDVTPDPFRPYYYVVTAVGLYGQSGNSNEASAYAHIGARAGLAERWQIGRANGPYAQANMSDGNQTFTIPIVGYAGRGLSTSFSLVQNSTDCALTGWPNPIAQGWTHSYNLSLDVDGTTGDVIVREGDSRQHFFRKNIDGSYTAQPGVYDTLVKNGDDTYTLTRKNQVALNFSTALRLASIVDAKGNTVTLTYDGGKLTTVEDATGRELTLDYDGSDRLSTITDPAERVWTLTYDGNGKLWKIEDPMEYLVVLGYDGSNRVNSLTDKRENTWSFQYDGSHRVTQVTNPRSNSRTYYYGSTFLGNPCITVTDENSNTETLSYDADGNYRAWGMMMYQDTRVYDSNHNLTSYTDKNGKTWAWTYDSRGNQLTSTNPLNKTVTRTYGSTTLNRGWPGAGHAAPSRQPL